MGWNIRSTAWNVRSSPWNIKLIAVSGLLIVFLKKMILCIRKQKGIFDRDSEAVLISFDKFVKHDLDECDLYHSFCGFSKEFVIDSQPSEVFQP